MGKIKKQFFGIGRNKDNGKSVKVTNGNDEQSEVKLIGIQNTKNKNVYANITRKKSVGANNWKTFIESNPSTKLSKVDGKIKDNKLYIRPNKNRSTESIIESDSKNKRSVVSLDVSASSNDYVDLTHESKKQYLISKCSTRKEPISFAKKPFLTDRHGNNIQKQSEGIQKSITDSHNNISLTKQIAMDCEMVGVEIGVEGNMLARISLVNAHGNCIYDKYVKPTEPVVSYRTHVSGIRPEDLVKATDFKTVQQEVADMLKGRVLVGHALKHDLRVLFLTHPKRDIRDTSKFKKFREGNTPALKRLAKQYLGVTIQEGEHSSVQDALAAMQLYKMFRKDWEYSIKCKNVKKQNNGESKKSIPKTDHIIL